MHTAEEVQNYLTPVDIPGKHRHFRCELCQKMTSDCGNMRRHMVIRHARPERLSCPHCKRIFSNKYYLRDHARICNKEHNYGDKLRDILNA